MRICVFAISLIVGAALAAVPASSAPFTTTNKAEWQALLLSSADFGFSAPNVALANEVGAPPLDNTALGGPLTFEAGNTGMPVDFTFAANEPGNQVIFVANGLGATPTADHDWIINLAPSPTIFAFGITVLGQGSSGDVFEVRDQAGALLASFDVSGSDTDPLFLGIINDTPIGSVAYEDAAIPGGRIALSVSFGQTASVVPLPATLPLLGAALGLLGLLCRRGQRFA